MWRNLIFSACMDTAIRVWYDSVWSRPNSMSPYRTKGTRDRPRPDPLGPHGYLVNQHPAESNLFWLFMRESLHDMMAVPEDAVLVEVSCWIEPHVELFLSTRPHASIPIDVGLKHPLLPLLVPQQFEVYLVVVVGVHVRIWHLRGTTPFQLEINHVFFFSEKYCDRHHLMMKWCQQKISRKK